jgi:SagB-type dehydrogenase family enzyme
LIKIFTLILLAFHFFINSFIVYALSEEEIKLPLPQLEGKMSVEESLARRRSRRTFKDDSLSIEQISQLLWAAQGITEKRIGFRTAPSAGATYPLDIYLVVGKEKSESLIAGVYHYHPRHHSLFIILEGDRRRELARACLRQRFIENAPISLIITVEFSRITYRYGKKGSDYANMEAGHVGQNVYLQAESLGLGTVVIGAFYEKNVAQVLNLPEKHIPLYVMPVGYY